MVFGKKPAIIDDDDAGEVSSCQKGDLDAFERLVRKYEKKMFNIAFRIAGNHEDACEIVQDAFVAAYRGIGAFRGAAKFSTWLTTITVNQARNRLKRVQGKRAHEKFSLADPLPTTDGGRTLDPPSNDPPVHEVLEKRAVQLKVQDCINALEPDFKEVLVLRDIQDYSYEEISTMLEVHIGTIKSRLFRAREAVKDCLQRAMGEV
jgi:RNA polymerase sigma-70 factor, ECF subfamily